MASYIIDIINGQHKNIGTFHTDDGLEWARAIAYYTVAKSSNADSVEYAIIRDKKGPVGYVFFDRGTYREYRSLGVVYCPLKGDQALHLTSSGKTSKFTNRYDVQQAKSLRKKLSSGHPVSRSESYYGW